MDTLEMRCWDGHVLPGERINSPDPLFKCPACDKNLFIQETSGSLARDGGVRAKLDFWNYLKRVLPAAFFEERVSMGEGGTKLVDSTVNQGDAGERACFKDESQNPTRSYRDRAAALLVTHARILHCKEVFCASTGNMGASVSAYAARAGLVARIFSDRSIDIGKKAQIKTYGGVLFDSYPSMNDGMDDCLKHQMAEGGYQATAEFNPLSMLAQKSIAYEIVSDGFVPDEVYISIGNGGTLFSLWQGFDDLRASGAIPSTPRMIGASLSTEGPRISPLKESKYSQRDLMENAIKESGGDQITITEGEITGAISTLARAEGLFVEPATAAAYAALKKRANRESGLKRVVILTGTGLKAPSVIDALISKAPNSDLFVQTKMNLRLKILEQLQHAGPAGLHGYRIHASILEDIQCTKQAVYHHLKQMEEKNFVVVIARDEQGRTIYQLTEKGKEVLDLLSRLVDLF
ncbi:MAG: pyridoxal-phosphate dependent enzyme [Candidatus Lokiarchaeota archaeon]|nr:pyridoxal-phosphate dependent enzyme [Candidatus Lokiarchaeota archaeon]